LKHFAIRDVGGIPFKMS